MSVDLAMSVEDLAIIRLNQLLGDYRKLQDALKKSHLHGYPQINIALEKMQKENEINIAFILELIEIINK